MILIIELSAYADEISPDLEIQMDVLDLEHIRYIDLRSVGRQEILDLSDEEIADIKRRLDERGFKIHSISTPIGKSSITEDFYPDLKKYKRAIELAERFGTPNIRIFSFYTPSDGGEY